MAVATYCITAGGTTLAPALSHAGEKSFNWGNLSFNWHTADARNDPVAKVDTVRATVQPGGNSVLTLLAEWNVATIVPQHAGIFEIVFQIQDANGAPIVPAHATRLPWFVIPTSPSSIKTNLPLINAGSFGNIVQANIVVSQSFVV